MTKTKTNTDIQLLDEYFLPDTNQQKYPALQATNYRPGWEGQEILIAMASNSVELLSDQAMAALDLTPEAFTFKGESTTLYVLPESVQWVVLGIPRTFCYDKAEKRYGHLEAGMKLAKTQKVTAAKLFLAAVVGKELLLNDDGQPQVFTLNLKSSKTNLIKSAKPEKDDGSIYSLNLALCEHYKKKAVLVHLVSVALVALGHLFSNADGDSSLGVKFRLAGNATPLTPDQQRLIFELIQSQNFQRDFQDPFKLLAKNGGLDFLDAPVDEEI